MPHFPKHLDVGDHCHLALWLTKFKKERAEYGPDRVVDLLSLNDIFRSPLITQGGLVGVFSRVKERIWEAQLALPKDALGTPYIKPAKAKDIHDAIEAYELISGTRSNESFVDFFLTPPAAGSAEAVLFATLRSKGLYVPPDHSSGDTVAIQAIIVGAPPASPPIWDMPFPDPLGGPDTTLGAVGYDVLFATNAKLLYVRYRSTFDMLRLAREHGILRAYQFNVMSTSQTPHSDAAGADSPRFELMNKKNGMCCQAGVGCVPTAPGAPPSYCEENSSGACNAMSESC